MEYIKINDKSYTKGEYQKELIKKLNDKTTAKEKRNIKINIIRSDKNYTKNDKNIKYNMEYVTRLVLKTIKIINSKAQDYNNKNFNTIDAITKDYIKAYNISTSKKEAKEHKTEYVKDFNKKQKTNKTKYVDIETYEDLKQDVLAFIYTKKINLYNKIDKKRTIKYIYNRFYWYNKRDKRNGVEKIEDIGEYVTELQAFKNYLLEDNGETHKKLNKKQVDFIHGLTEKQKNILLLISKGYSQRETAYILKVSNGTIAKTIQRLQGYYIKASQTA